MKESRKEFIKKAHSAACSEWKTNIEKEFPKLFKKDALVAGKWYKIADSGDHITGLDQDHNLIFVEEFNKYNIAKRVNELCKENVNLLYENHLFGHNPSGKKVLFGSKAAIKGLTPATEKEVEEALIKEAKKRGFKEGVNFNVTKDLWNTSVGGREGFNTVIDKNTYNYSAHSNSFKINCIDGCMSIFTKGVWAEIVETITKEQAEKELGKTILD